MVSPLPRAQGKKSFGSFLQKRTASFRPHQFHSVSFRTYTDTSDRAGVAGGAMRQIGIESRGHAANEWPARGQNLDDAPIPLDQPVRLHRPQRGPGLRQCFDIGTVELRDVT